MSGNPTITHCDDPHYELDKAADIASFLSYVADQVGFHKCGDELADEGWRGLAHILRDMKDRISGADAALAKVIEDKYVNTLRRIGCPEHAFTDEKMRTAWRDGFARGLAHREEEAAGHGAQ